MKKSKDIEIKKMKNKLRNKKEEKEAYSDLEIGFSEQRSGTIYLITSNHNNMNNL